MKISFLDRAVSLKPTKDEKCWPSWSLAIISSPYRSLLVSGGGTCPVISLTQQRSSPNPAAPPRTSRGKRTPGRLTKPPHSIDSSGYEIDVGRKRPIACATPSSRRDPTSLKCNIPPNTLGWENLAPTEATSKPGTAPSGETPDSRTVHWTSRNQ